MSGFCGAFSGLGVVPSLQPQPCKAAVLMGSSTQHQVLFLVPVGPVGPIISDLAASSSLEGGLPIIVEDYRACTWQC